MHLCPFFFRFVIFSHFVFYFLLPSFVILQNFSCFQFSH
jgi:hypothetical protein